MNASEVLLPISQRCKCHIFVCKSEHVELDISKHSSFEENHIYYHFLASLLTGAGMSGARMSDVGHFLFKLMFNQHQQHSAVNLQLSL